jgi:hypothetical protein
VVLDNPVLPIVPIHPEGPRYTVSLVFVGGLWMRPDAFRGVAAFFGHRGWHGQIVDFGGLSGGLAARTEAVVEIAAALPSPPVLIGHDVGGVVACAAACRVGVAAVVWLAPLGPADPTLARAVRPWRAAGAAALRMGMGRPGGEAGRLLFGRERADDLSAEENGHVVLDALRPGGGVSAPPVPLAVVAGERDPIGRDVAVADATRLVVPGAGRWLLGGSAWQPCVGLVHRWLIQSLGAELLELHEEMMAEREQDPD